MSRPRLTVVTHQPWRAEDLAPHVQVHVNLGLDTSAGADPAVAIWSPGAWAAAATARHGHLRLSSAGPMWLDRVYQSLSGRDIRTATAGDLIREASGEHAEPVFAKLPETKHESFTASTREIGKLLAQLSRLPADEPVQLQSPVHFEYEVRCWLLHGEVVARGAYFPDVSREQWPSLDDPARSADAAAWLTRLLPHYLSVPPAVVVDVGWCADPVTGPAGWRIIEANAPWSSDWYIPDDMAAVVETVIASQRDVPDEWCWRPSPLLMRRCAGLIAR